MMRLKGEEGRLGAAAGPRLEAGRGAPWCDCPSLWGLPEGLKEAAPLFEGRVAACYATSRDDVRKGAASARR